MLVCAHSGTFDDPLQAMEFTQAKIHSLVAYCTESEEGDRAGEWSSHILSFNKCMLFLLFTDAETLRFRDVEKRFMRQFNLPPEEKLVNCECIILMWCVSCAVQTTHVAIGRAGYHDRAGCICQ